MQIDKNAMMMNCSSTRVQLNPLKSWILCGSQKSLDPNGSSQRCWPCRGVLLTRAPRLSSPGPLPIAKAVTHLLGYPGSRELSKTSLIFCWRRTSKEHGTVFLGRFLRLLGRQFLILDTIFIAKEIPGGV